MRIWRKAFLAIGWILTAVCYFECLKSYGRMETRDTMTIVFSDHCPGGKEVRSILKKQEEAKSEEILCFYWEGTLVSVAEPAYARSTRAHLAGIQGEAALFDRRIRGFSDDDREGCIIDRETAEELFGSTDITGRKLVIGKKTYVVRKVMDWKQRCILIHDQDESAVYSRVFYQCGGGNKTAMANQFLMRYGLTGEQAAAGALQAASCAAVWMLPILVFLKLLIYGMGQKKRASGRREQVLWMAACLVLVAVFIRVILQNVYLSADWLPGKWSDFDFWSRRMEEEQKKTEYFFMISRTAGEIEMLWKALRTVSSGILGTVLCLVLMRREKRNTD